MDGFALLRILVGLIPVALPISIMFLPDPTDPIVVQAAIINVVCGFICMAIAKFSVWSYRGIKAMIPRVREKFTQMLTLPEHVEDHIDEDSLPAYRKNVVVVDYTVRKAIDALKPDPVVAVTHKPSDEGGHPTGEDDV